MYALGIPWRVRQTSKTQDRQRMETRPEEHRQDDRDGSCYPARSAAEDKGEQMSTSPVSDGDTVVLKSGGPKMVVHQASVNGILCVWFDDKKHVHQYLFQPSVLLKLVEESNE